MQDTKVAQHTPGPWAIDDEDGTIRAADGDRLFDPLVRFPAQRLANKQLVVASPDLLEALKALHANVDGDLSGYWAESTSNFMQQAEAAIAKAEGR